MMHRFAAALAATVLVTTSLAAQSAKDVCSAIGHLKVGQWSEVRVNSDSSAMRFAAVGTEQQDGKTYYWIELKGSDPTHGTMIAQYLVPGFPFQFADVKAIIMKMGDAPAMRLPEQMIQAMSERMPHDAAMNLAARCASAKVVGWENVTVAAGTFHALHVQDTTSAPGAATGGRGDFWVSPDVPFGLVKATDPHSGTIELVGTGKDAKSSITEPPQTLGAPGH